MVAYGASAAVGLIEEGDANRPFGGRDQPQPAATQSDGIVQCLGRRLDVYAHRDC